MAKSDDLADKHDLVDLIRDLARKGKLNHLTLGITWKEGNWQAGYRDAVSTGYSISTDPDPVNALLLALLGKGYRHIPGQKPDPDPPRQQPIRGKAKRDLLG
jgi:hypothetical protein